MIGNLELYYFSVSLGLLSIEDLATVLEAIWDIRNQWYNLGLLLRIPASELDSIDKDNANIGDCARSTLKFWLQNAERPTWAALVNALQSPIVGQFVVADRIQKQYYY